MQIHLDDFGAGYSALAYLQRLPLDCLKIDRGFISGLCNNPGDRAIVSAILSMAEGLGLGVVAEGVETVEQQQTLREMGCQLAQGYWFGVPVPGHELWEPKALSTAAGD